MIKFRYPYGVLMVLVFGLFFGPSARADDALERVVDDARLAGLEKMTGDRPADIVLELALAYDERGQSSKAMEFYQQAAAQGVGVAELRLGWLYESGTGGEQNYTLARAHYKRAVAAGVAEANLRLGLFCLEGWGMTRDVPAAVVHLQAAANAGYQPAQKILSEMYFSGTGVATDLKQALVWAEKAAAKHDPAAQTLVGAIRQKAARLPQDIGAAREWYQLSAEQEYTDGMRAMASTFLQKGANPEEVNLGIRWMELASENGDYTATFYLAGMYLWFPQLRQKTGSQEKAHELLKKSSQGGEMAASEVLELASEGLSLADAFRYVKTVPMENRYVRRLAARQPTEKEIAAHGIPPRPIKMVSPIYPAAMKLTKTDGKVVVEFIVDTTGRVRAAQVVSTTHQAFADHALASVAAWRFVPGYKNGRAVNTRIQVPVIFQMSGAGGLDAAKFRAKAEKS